MRQFKANDEMLHFNEIWQCNRRNTTQKVTKNDVKEGASSLGFLQQIPIEITNDLFGDFFLKIDGVISNELFLLNHSEMIPPKCQRCFILNVKLFIWFVYSLHIFETNDRGDRMRVLITCCFTPYMYKHGNIHRLVLIKRTQRKRNGIEVRLTSSTRQWKPYNANSFDQVKMRSFKSRAN